MSNQRRKYWYLALALALALAAGAWHFGPRLFYAEFGFLVLGPEEGGPSPEQKRELGQKLDGLRARVVWSSSRSGNHELYMLDTSDLSLYQLTRDPHVDYFPRFSPDGRRLVFARSQKEWASERELDAWDAWVLDLENGQERLAAKGANFPQWVDGGRISFMRGSAVVVKDLADGRESIVFDGQASPIKGSIATPELSPADPGKLALTAFGRVRGVAVADLKEGRVIPLDPGCEVTWFPDGRRLLWVETEGGGGSRLVSSPLARKDRKILIDLPGEHSHEYFPRLSRDGRYLVWGASREGHEHDIADYEIFLWKLGTPPESALRLSHNSANDRWPDIHIP